MDKVEAKMIRDTALYKGTVTKDKKFWFNEDTGVKFCIKMNTTISIGEKSFKWVNAKREVVEVSISDAKKYAKEILATLDKVYLGE